ncbi:hypothetical protein SASPL_144531 [Salvia splendens]|uniref:Uncharacterized protein n=1 Tax=Salvia splendens TaxID=180675 RepID=A0A8X8WFV9_SALSN|nr:hypothetical protein SASPL_144531 [Salvia splendens]
MVDQYDPGCFGVRLANREQREKWDILVRLKVIPSRYPDEEALEALGLGDCFWELSRPMKDKGEMFLSFEVLKEIELITVDSRQRVFFIQEAGDHFPLPNPSYTYVHGWHITKNWRLNSDAHKAIVKATPAYVPLNPQYRPGIPFQSNPQSMRPDLALLPHQAPPQEEHAHDDQGPSQQRRTRRRTGPQHADDADDVSLAERVDHLGTRIDHVEASMRQHLEQLTQRFDHYHKVNDERWGRVENTVGEMLRRFQTFPNPLLPPEQKEKWARLVDLKVIPSRYPDEEALEALGLGDCFWELSREGEGQMGAEQGQGEMFLSFEVLKDLEFIMVDDRQRVFFIQKGGGYFPLPNPSYTYVNGWHFTQNWRLNTEAHNEIMDATPVYVPLNPHYRPDTNFRSNQQPMMQEPAQEEHAHDGEGPSEQRRTRRRLRPQHDDGDDDDVLLAERVDHLGIRIDHAEAAMHQHVEQLNQRFDHYHKVNGERWGRVENMLDEMVRGFETFPNPLPRPSQ